MLDSVAYAEGYRYGIRREVYSRDMRYVHVIAAVPDWQGVRGEEILVRS